MNKWSPERAEAIRQFIDEYFMENRKSPTVRDIAAGTGISKTSVQRYLTDMKEHGEIEYNGRRSIGTNLSRNMFETTPAIRYDSTVSCGLPSEPNVEEADIIPLPTALVGEGRFFILPAKGESLTENVISSVGSEIFTKGSASDCPFSQIVSPIVTSPIPLIAIIFPAELSVTGLRSRPSNSYRETAFALRGGSSVVWKLLTSISWF